MDECVATWFWWETVARKGAAGIGTTCSGNSMYVQLGAARDGRDPYMTYGASRGTLMIRHDGETPFHSCKHGGVFGDFFIQLILFSSCDLVIAHRQNLRT